MPPGLHDLLCSAREHGFCSKHARMAAPRATGVPLGRHFGGLKWVRLMNERISSGGVSPESPTSCGGDPTAAMGAQRRTAWLAR